MKKLLIVDTETTGLPISYTAPVTDTYNWPRIVEFAWELCYENGETIKKVSSLVEPDGWEVPVGGFWEEHNLNTADCFLYGVPMPELLGDFADVVFETDVLIAHNLSYDLPIILCELYRYRMKTAKVPERFCTKTASEHILKLPSGFPGKYKWPTLDEAYRFFYGKGIMGAHEAGSDVESCKQVYLAIKKYQAENQPVKNKYEKYF